MRQNAKRQALWKRPVRPYLFIKTMLIACERLRASLFRGASECSLERVIMTDRPKTPLLDKVASPADMKRLSDSELVTLAGELRAETISAVSETGGHLGAGLGVIELTVALHAVFDAPKDKIIWDVSHQSYPHKILTGRRDRIRTLRKRGGLSGFTKRSESPYDCFGAAHIAPLRSARRWALLWRATWAETAPKDWAMRLPLSAMAR